MNLTLKYTGGIAFEIGKIAKKEKCTAVCSWHWFHFPLLKIKLFEGEISVYFIQRRPEKC